MRIEVSGEWQRSAVDGKAMVSLPLSVGGGVGRQLLLQVSKEIGVHLVSQGEGSIENLDGLVEPCLLVLFERLNHLGEDGLESLFDENSEKYLVDVAEADAKLARRLLADKQCRYQCVENGDLFCKVLTTVSGSRGCARPVTRHRCKHVCQVMDRRLMCDEFCHPEVYEPPGSTRVELRMALCGLGRGEVSTDPARCRPGGHACWVREVVFEKPIAEEHQAIDLNEMIDYFNVSWKSRFGAYLFNSFRATDGGDLVTPVRVRKDLVVKLNVVVDLLKSAELPGKGHVFDRIEQALGDKIREGYVDPEDALAAMTSAIGVVRKVALLRNKYHHGGVGSSKLRDAFHEYGLPYPPPPASETWEKIRSDLIRALKDLCKVTNTKMATVLCPSLEARPELNASAVVGPSGNHGRDRR